MAGDMAVVVATRNRWPTLDRTLSRLASLPERPLVVVVDNGSSDGTPGLVRSRHPGVAMLALPANVGAAARTAGARLAGTTYVAFSDDDSWWEPGALATAAKILSGDAGVALTAATVRVGEDGALDPVSAAMARGRRRRGRWAEVSGFLACAAVVRRDAFLAAGGFHPDLALGGEEELLALDLAASGWSLLYTPETVARHHPDPVRDAAGRRRLMARNAVLVGWHRLPAGVATRRTLAAARRAGRDPAVLRGLGQAAAGLGWAAGGRRPVPTVVARAHLDDQRAARA